MKIHFICNLKLFFLLVPVLAIALQSNTLLAAPCSRCNVESITTILVERDQSETIKKTVEIFYCSNCNRKPWIESPLSNWERVSQTLANIGSKTGTVSGTTIGVTAGFMAGGIPGATVGGAAGAALGYGGSSIFKKTNNPTAYVSQANLEDAFKACETSDIDDSYRSSGQLDQDYPTLVDAALHDMYGRIDQQIETAHTDTAHSLCFSFIQKKLSKAKHDETLKYFHDNWTDSRAKVSFPEDEADLHHSEEFMSSINQYKGRMTSSTLTKMVETMQVNDSFIIDIKDEVQMAVVCFNSCELHCYIPRLSTVKLITAANAKKLVHAVMNVAELLQTSEVKVVWPKWQVQDTMPATADSDSSRTGRANTNTTHGYNLRERKKPQQV